MAVVAVLPAGCSPSGTSGGPTSPTTSSTAPAAGTYRGTFRIDTVETLRNTIADGRVAPDCPFNVALVGTLTIDVDPRGTARSAPIS